MNMRYTFYSSWKKISPQNDPSSLPYGDSDEPNILPFKTQHHLILFMLFARHRFFNSQYIYLLFKFLLNLLCGYGQPAEENIAHIVVKADKWFELCGTIKWCSTLVIYFLLIKICFDISLNQSKRVKCTKVDSRHPLDETLNWIYIYSLFAGIFVFLKSCYSY